MHQPDAYANIAFLHICDILEIFPANRHFDSTQMQMDQEDDDMVGPLPIEKLAEAGINTSDIKKLKAQGMFTIESVRLNSEFGKQAAPVQNSIQLPTRLLSVPTNFLVTFVGSVTQKLKKSNKLRQNLSQWVLQPYVYSLRVNGRAIHHPHLWARYSSSPLFRRRNTNLRDKK